MLKQGSFSNHAMTVTFVVLLRWLPVAQLATNKSWVPSGNSEAGYDGQFYAQIALDPTLRNPGLKDACDNLAYRAQLIAMPVASYVLGLGQPRWIEKLRFELKMGC